jgi:translation initiation factor SUI1
MDMVGKNFYSGYVPKNVKSIKEDEEEANGLHIPTPAEKKSKKKKDKKEKDEAEDESGYAAPGAVAQDNSTDYIHIRNQQRNGRKSITSLCGLPATFNVQKILKAFKKELNCNGNIVEDEKHGRVIQIQGDKRQDMLR